MPTGFNLRQEQHALTTLTRERGAEPSFGVVDLSAAFGKKVVFASFAAKQVAEPAVADQTKLGRAASVTFFTYGNLLCARHAVGQG